MSDANWSWLRSKLEGVLTNTFLGWTFLLLCNGAIYANKPEAVVIGWLILAKLCWIHADVRMMRDVTKEVEPS